MTTATEPIVRVTRGSLSDEELAALTAVLLARAAATQQAAALAPVEPIARWHRVERRPAYYSPVSWQWAA